MFRTRLLFTCMASICLASTLLAGPVTHFNVDSVALPGGPIQLIPVSSSYDSMTNQWTLSAKAKNNGPNTVYDIKFLNQFVFDGSAALTFNDGTDTWSAGMNTFSMANNTGTFNMMNTDAATSSTLGLFTGTLGSMDTVPYFQIGNLLPGQEYPFTMIANANSNYAFTLRSTFVAIPEPSSVALVVGLGLAGLAALRKRRVRQA